MARRIKSKKRKFLGHRSYGGGNAKNRRGKGNKGGKGRAGWHKHKWLRTIKLGEHIRRKYGFASTVPKPTTMTLAQLTEHVAAGKHESKDGAPSIRLPDHTIVHSPSFSTKVHVTAFRFTNKARESILAAGGTATSLKRVKPPKPKGLQDAGTQAAPKA